MTPSANELRLTRVPVAKKGMLIRRPPADVFRAFADPAITTKFWFTKSSGEVAPGATLRWDWEMFGASAEVSVKDVQPNSRIAFQWGAIGRQVTESGFSGTGDEVAAAAADSASGFALVLAAAKALLEHDIVLAVVRDHVLPGVEP